MFRNLVYSRFFEMHVE